MQQLPARLRSIDVFRAITMLLMIFVNDVDGVSKIPEWIKHAGEHDNLLGFADTIFPAFLFIVGLSLPFAIQNRLREGKGKLYVSYHILLRSLALIVMGFFHVNLENYSSTALLPEPVWEILITMAFFLIWLNYPKSINNLVRVCLQCLGIAVLIAMAFLYKGEHHGHVVGLRTQWWGILGLIGWAYLFSALIFLFTNGKLFAQVIALIIFLALDVIANAFPKNYFTEALYHVPTIGDSATPSLVMAGVVISVLYKEMIQKNKSNKIWYAMIAFAAIFFAFGFITRPFGGISKIDGTPSWVGICTGINILVFVLLIYIVDVNHHENWARIIRPAGTSTLTCYLIPYLLYSFYELLHFNFPAFLSEGVGGILRSFATAFVVIFIAAFLEKKHLNLKI